MIGYCIALKALFLGARGLVRGQFFNREGKLVASTMQEGLLRQIGEDQ